MFFKREVGITKKKGKLTFPKTALGYFLSFLIGVYAGFFGGGWATLYSYLLILVFGLTFLESAGTRKIVALFMDVATLSVFVLNQKVNFLYGFVMFVGSGLGSYLGADYSLKKGDTWVRKLFILVVSLSAVRLLI